MKREDLFGANREMAAELADQIGRLAPHAKVLVATEPVDMITAEVVRHSGLNRRQVMGIGGCLDAARLRFFAARELGLSAESISALVIGRHSDAMIVLLRYCSVSGLPLTSLLSEEQLESILEKTRNAGDLIVGMAQEPALSMLLQLRQRTWWTPSTWTCGESCRSRCSCRGSTESTGWL
jgi:malate dehydrogenase